MLPGTDKKFKHKYDDFRPLAGVGRIGPVALGIALEIQKSVVWGSWPAETGSGQFL